MTFATKGPATPGSSTAGHKLLHLTQRHPQRITITISHAVHERLVARSHEEGRSMSNLCAYLLEQSLRPDIPTQRKSA
jgi:hypothetical protein